MILITIDEYIEAKRAADPDFSLYKMAEATGVSRSTLYRYLNGQVEQADLTVVYQLCRYFDLPPGPVPFIIYQD